MTLLLVKLISYSMYILHYIIKITKKYFSNLYHTHDLSRRRDIKVSMRIVIPLLSNRIDKHKKSGTN